MAKDNNQEKTQIKIPQKMKTINHPKVDGQPNIQLKTHPPRFI
jgi:hypothetical protein